MSGPVDQPSVAPVTVSPEVADVLRALLLLPPAAVYEVRDRTRRRTRPRRQVGPSAEYGAD